MANKQNLACCFVNTDQLPLSSKHIAFSASTILENGSEYIVINEVVENNYPHPEYPKEATINCLEVRTIYKQLKSSNLAFAGTLLELAEITVQEFVAKIR